MEEFTIQSPAEQVALRLRRELLRGRWSGEMPGMARISEELNVDHKTVMAALHLLEDEGFLINQGAGKRRKIALPHDAVAPTRIAFLLHDVSSASLPHTIQLRNALEQAGHTSVIPDKNLQDLNMEVKRVARLVRSVDANAWIVSAGSQEVLEWFTAQPVPSFAIFGRMEGLPIAGVKPNKSEAFVAVTRRLVELGHRRIVLIAQTERRLPEPGRVERAFLNELESHGIQTGPYNLPHWEDSPQGLRTILSSLLQVTPPTALLVEDVLLFTAVLNLLAHRGIRVPEDVSLICTDNDPTFAWCQPTIAHIDWDARPVVRRVVRWAANASRGKEDVKQTFTKATFVDGGTVGRVKE